MFFKMKLKNKKWKQRLLEKPLNYSKFPSKDI